MHIPFYKQAVSNNFVIFFNAASFFWKKRKKLLSGAVGKQMLKGKNIGIRHKMTPLQRTIETKLLAFSLAVGRPDWNGNCISSKNTCKQRE